MALAWDHHPAYPNHRNYRVYTCWVPALALEKATGLEVVWVLVPDLGQELVPVRAWVTALAVVRQVALWLTFLWFWSLVLFRHRPF
jgi:hypothetical protein